MRLFILLWFSCTELDAMPLGSVDADVAVTAAFNSAALLCSLKAFATSTVNLAVSSRAVTSFNSLNEEAINWPKETNLSGSTL